MSRRKSRKAAGSVCHALLMSLAAASAHAGDLSIARVQASKTQVDASRGDSVRLGFDLSAPASVALQLYDGRDLLIREIRGEKTLPRGEHAITWDLHDQAGRPVPPEAYAYVLEAKSPNGEVVRYDLTDATSGDSVPARDVKWDAPSGQLSYILDRPSRVNVRLGLQDGGPLLRTLADWVVRPAGVNVERWDGKDNSGVLDLATHPKLAISVQAFALPDNSILVGAPQTKVMLIEKSSLKAAKKRESTASAPKRMYAHAQQPLEARGDFSVSLTLPKTLARSSSGVPIVSAPIPVRLDVDPADRERALTRRFEPVFFVDGQFAFENETGFVPMTWNFDPSNFNAGEHFLTVNLRGYEGNFGMATVKIIVERPTASDRKK